MKLDKLKEYVKEVAREEMKTAQPGSLPRDPHVILVEVLVEQVDVLEAKVAKLEKALEKAK